MAVIVSAKPLRLRLQDAPTAAIACPVIGLHAKRPLKRAPLHGKPHGDDPETGQKAAA